MEPEPEIEEVEEKAEETAAPAEPGAVEAGAEGNGTFLKKYRFFCGSGVIEILGSFCTYL